MNRSELQEALSKELNSSPETAKSVIDTILDSMTNTLVNGEGIEIKGFGSFTVRYYDSYTGCNPNTREKVFVKAKKLPVFRVGKELRENVNSGRKHK
jgi:integration host factor subunit beta